MRSNLARLIAVVVVTGLVAGLAALYLVGTANHAIADGDEAIYAQMAREMAHSGDYVDLRWQGQVELVRPPLVVWTLALAHRALGDERAVRWPLAAAAALTVALVLLYGFALGRGQAMSPARAWAWGAVAAGLLATSDLFIGYSRYLESEPFLCALVVAAWLLWEVGRRRVSARVGWGLLAGAALLCKQGIGGLALLPLLVDLVLPRDPTRRRWPTRLGIALIFVVAVPWHALDYHRHGYAFVDSYLLGNLLERARTPLLHVTRWTFYARELWRSEGGFALLGALGVAVATWRMFRPDDRRVALLLVGATLGPLLLFTVARSRYDYYLLVIYPPAALAVGWALVRLPLRPSVVGGLALLLVVAQALLRCPQLARFSGEDELRSLVATADRVGPGGTLYLYNRHPYAARFYSHASRVVSLLESRTDLSDAERLQRTGMPISAELAESLPDALRALPRPWALLLPKPRAALLAHEALLADVESAHYLLYLSK